MQLGCLTTIAARQAGQPHHGDHGQRPLPDHRRPAHGRPPGVADYVALARAAGLVEERLGGRRGRFRQPWSTRRSPRAGRRSSPRASTIKPGVGTTDRDPVQIRERFMHGPRRAGGAVAGGGRMQSAAAKASRDCGMVASS